MMNKAALILALIVVCAFGSNPKDEGDTFYPKDFDCSFSIEYSLTKYGETKTGTYSGYGYSRSFTADYNDYGEKVWTNDILRADVNLGEEGQAMYVMASKYGSSKYCDRIGYVDNHTKIGEIYEYVEEPFTYDKLEVGTTWNGQSCDHYSYGDYANLYVKDDRVIGYEDSYTTLTAKYSSVAYEDDFVVRKDYDGCGDEAYEPIEKIKGCDLESRTTKFVPEPFPCAYMVKFTLEQSEGPSGINGYEQGYGHHLAFHIEGKMYGKKYSSDSIQRADIQEKGEEKSAAVFAFDDLPVESECHTWYNNRYDKNLDEVSMIHEYIANDIVYVSKKENVKFDGENCDEYIDEDGHTFYTRDGHIVGYVATYDGDKETYTFSYKDYAYEGDFAVPKKYDDCITIKEAFDVPPKVEGCEAKSGRSAASTVQAFAFFVIASIVCVLF